MITNFRIKFWCKYYNLKYKLKERVRFLKYSSYGILGINLSIIKNRAIYLQIGFCFNYKGRQIQIVLSK